MSLLFLKDGNSGWYYMKGKKDMIGMNAELNRFAELFYNRPAEMFPSSQSIIIF